MTNKILRRSTIIPSGLYIERAADRQLKSIVDDMGRPGYVLVARQMGKTNLLIHMKRTRVNDLVLYKDLSTQFETSRAFFRDIIDSLLESFPELQNNDISIASLRNNELEPNIEYDRHLRMLLKNTTKKVVIVLDEIDSLVNSPFSDVIFAQIRSMYFSRINFPEYEQLTYVLSGVAEPTDLIKNKNISPFNIGEKIYLEDFDRTEYEEFISRANLVLSSDVRNEIYNWTSGNPRITWDICTEIEDLIISKNEIEISTVKDVVHKLYLRDFDRAPIDHIRTLVETDKIVRDAVISIRWGKADFIDDKTKSRLYLSGITGSAGGEARIKNKIIDDALSDSWIKSVTPNVASPILLALSYHAFGDHSSVITKFEEIKADPVWAAKLTLTQRLQFASSYLWTKKPELALEEFRHCLGSTTGSANRQDSELRIGNVLSYFKEYSSAVEFFKSASEGPSLILKFNAQLNLAETYRASGLENDSQTLEIINNLLLKLDTPDIHASEAGRNLYVAASVCQAGILMKMDRHEEADVSLQKAFPMAVYSTQPKLLLLRYECVTDPLEQQDILVQLCGIVMDNSLVTLTFDGADLHFDNKQVAQILSCLLKQNMTELFDDFLNYVTSEIFATVLCRVDVVLTCINSIPSKEERVNNVGLLIYCAENYLDDSVPAPTRLKLYREISSSTPLPQAMMWRIRYLDEIERHSNHDHLLLDDIQSLSFTSYYLRKDKQFAQLDRLYSFWEKIQAKACELSLFWSVFVMAHGMLFHRETKQIAKAKKYATLTLEIIELNQKELLSSGSSEDFLSIRGQAEEILRVRIEHDPYRHIGRNQKVQVKYGESRPVTVKFKQIKEDLAKGKCIMLDDK
ncbi:AAA-like domain-containing protein [Pseudomonas sp. EL_65y_Pfl2_R96]|uniref:AAA-like domain-containing protein n=1 Tax=Pseudomonas sp. EL_65y_Pfl2_R96 TaxID=3088699 RepID=UPI0030DD60E9